MSMTHHQDRNPIQPVTDRRPSQPFRAAGGKVTAPPDPPPPPPTLTIREGISGPTPTLPKMPPCRVSYEGLGGQLMFSSQEELDKWKAEPFWKKVLGLTEYDKRLRS